MRKKASDQLLREAESTEKAEKDMKNTLKDSQKGKRERGAHLNLDDVDEGDETPLCKCMYVCGCVYICVYMYTRTCMRKYMHCMCVCVHTYIQIHTNSRTCHSGTWSCLRVCVIFRACTREFLASVHDNACLHTRVTVQALRNFLHLLLVFILFQLASTGLVFFSCVNCAEMLHLCVCLRA
jgi:hypothetical protein